ncbi:MAG TPA: aspartate dehydrogenase [Candidatus Goldiibacteriota bacterium]|nr:aspartate dehydrogenase [Candidatus Goldiibacteriota bacterium]
MEARKKKLGIIGCGNIGNEIAAAVDKGDINVELYACYDSDKKKYDALCAKNGRCKPLFLEPEQLMKACDLVVECAVKSAVRGYFESAIRNNRDIMFLSAGGVLDCMDLLEEAKRKMINIYVPSGAVVGIDGLDAAMYSGLRNVTLITRKPPKAFKGNEWLEKKKIDLDSLTTETVVFDGSAREAVEAFPANVNVAATLSIAGIGPDRTRVKVVVDPFINSNMHEIVVEGDFGRFRVISENLPSPNNPKTSYLTALSVIVMIKKIVEPIHIGT